MAPLSELPASTAEGDELPFLRTAIPGPVSRRATERLERVECPAFSKRRREREERAGADMAPIVLGWGKGSNLVDVDGNRFVDLVAGFGSVLLGHGDKAVARAIEGQSERLLQGLGDVYGSDAKVALLERLSQLHPTPGAQVLLAQSGSDAVTAALKTAVLATGRPGVVAFEGAYHGLGYGPLPACGLRESYRAPFAEQLSPHVRFAPYPRAEAALDRSLEAVEASLRGGEVGAVLVEPVLGRGGCVVPPGAFVPRLAEIAHRHGALLVADEIWTGLGRAGALVSSVAAGAAVDVICLGKGLGGGLPLSACVASPDVMAAWARGGEVVHTSTHAGAPLACAVALATLEAVRSRKLVDRSRDVGARVLASLRADLEGVPGVVDVRGAGLMIGVELESPARGLAAMRGLLESGFLVITGGVRGEVLTLTPALTIAEELFAAVGPALRSVLGA
jgi:4-aminobutyrate aminotransferase/(S)-3-amino-2-methylpropionate transaminase